MRVVHETHHDNKQQHFRTRGQYKLGTFLSGFNMTWGRSIETRGRLDYDHLSTLI